MNEQQKAYLLSLFNQLSPGQQEQTTTALEELAAAVEAGDRDAFLDILTEVNPLSGPQVASPLWHMLNMGKAAGA